MKNKNLTMLSAKEAAQMAAQYTSDASFIASAFVQKWGPCFIQEIYAHIQRRASYGATGCFVTRNTYCTTDKRRCKHVVGRGFFPTTPLENRLVDNRLKEMLYQEFTDKGYEVTHEPSGYMTKITWKNPK